MTQICRSTVLVHPHWRWELPFTSPTTPLCFSSLSHLKCFDYGFYIMLLWGFHTDGDALQSQSESNARFTYTTHSFMFNTNLSLYVGDLFFFFNWVDYIRVEIIFFFCDFTGLVRWSLSLLWWLLTLVHKFVGTIIVQVNFSLKSFVNFSHFSLESFANFSPKHWYFSVNFLYFSHLCMLMVKCMHQHSLIVPTEKKFYSCVTNDKLWKIFTLGCCKSCLWPRTFWLLFFPLLFNNVLIF